MQRRRIRPRATLRRATVLALLSTGLLSEPTLTHSQVGPLLTVRPWPEKSAWAETFDELLFFDRGHTKGASESIRSFYWDSLGRIKFQLDDSDPPFWLGYRILTLDTDSDSSFLDGQLNDVSVVAAGRLGRLFGSDFRLNLSAGLGTANDGHWSNDDALYGVGTADVWMPVSADASIHTGIYYDGNRPLIQDVPLPLLAYQHRVGGELDLVAGFPDTQIAVRPLEQLRLSFLYHFPVEVRVRADYELFRDSGLYAFALYARSTRPFYIDEGDNRRVFYEIDRVTAGVRWLTRWFDASLGVGYALDHHYRVGWDIGDANTFRDLSEELYVSFTLEGTFP